MHNNYSFSKKITVIVPVYGVDRYIEKCLDSIINQTYKNLEILIIDDGSKDSSPKIINEYAQKDSRIIAIHKKNRGYGHSCNLGLDRATGYYISIIEPDDFIEPDMFMKLVTLIERSKADIVKSAYFENYDSYVYKGCKKVDWKDKAIPIEKKFSLSENATFLSLHPSIWSCIYKRSLIEKYHIRFVEPPGAAWADNLFQIQTLYYADGIAYTPIPYYHYRKYHSNPSKELRDPLIPLKRLEEIDSWLEYAKIQEEEILKNLYSRELYYFRLVLSMKKNNKAEEVFNKIAQLCNKIKIREGDKIKFLLSKKDLIFFELCNKNVKLAYAKVLLRVLRKKFIEIRLTKKKRMLKLFGFYLYKNDNCIKDF